MTSEIACLPVCCQMLQHAVMMLAEPECCQTLHDTLYNAAQH